jgi:hypothetical protein
VQLDFAEQGADLVWALGPTPVFFAREPQPVGAVHKTYRLDAIVFVLDEGPVRIARNCRELVLKGKRSFGRGWLLAKCPNRVEPLLPMGPKQRHDFLRVWDCRRPGNEGRVVHGGILSCEWRFDTTIAQERSLFCNINWPNSSPRHPRKAEKPVVFQGMARLHPFRSGGTEAPVQPGFAKAGSR